MLEPLTVTVDSRLRLPPGLPRSLTSALKKTCTHANPDFHKKRAMGFATWGTPSSIVTWLVEDRGLPSEYLSLPRGATRRLREVLAEHGHYPRFIDRRCSPPVVDWPAVRFTPHWYQDEAVEHCMRHEQAIVRAPTGSGKTLAAFSLMAEVRRPALVIVRDGNLLAQWSDKAVEQAGFYPKEIGVLRGGKRLRVGARLTLALQQTLYSKTFPIDDVARSFGLVVVDEAHLSAARTFQVVIDALEARYRVALSADETRKDQKEFLVYDMFGREIYEIDRDRLEDEGKIHPVDVVMVPTEFSADWYANAEAGERDFTRLLDEMIRDEERNALAVDVVRGILERGEGPTLIFTHRVAHATELADVHLFAAGVRCGLLLGGAENATRYAEDKERIALGTLPVAAGTFAAMGQGIDMPSVRSGILATPIGANRQFFGQVRGRVCRTSAGKTGATLYVLWDRAVFPRMADQIEAWNGGRTTILGG